MGVGARRAGRRAGRARRRRANHHRHHRTGIRHNIHHRGRVRRVGVVRGGRSATVVHLRTPAQKVGCVSVALLFMFAFVSVPLLSIGSSEMGALFYIGISFVVLAVVCLITCLSIQAKKSLNPVVPPSTTSTTTFTTQMGSMPSTVFMTNETGTVHYPPTTEPSFQQPSNYTTAPTTAANFAPYYAPPMGQPYPNTAPTNQIPTTTYRPQGVIIHADLPPSYDEVTSNDIYKSPS